MIGACHFALKNYLDAMPYFTKAISLSGWKADAHLMRGKCKGMLGDLRGSIADFDKTLQQYGIEERYSSMPSIADAYLCRGLAYYQLGNKDFGCRDLRKAMELGHPTAPEFVQQGCN